MTTTRPTSDDDLVLNDPTHAEPLGHGNSPAAWTLVLLLLLGAVLVSIGMLADLMFLTIAGIVAAAAGVIAGFVMGKAGMGTKGHAKAARH
ncbi:MULTISPECIES: HGxxPAAW family protein [Citricoccus]|uniref:HGxxPAAW family protein n=1 Tax=Citricoccus TaxID=169133 RepID=UPI000255EBB5|nr:HGxxPAAW family protein [Citricoccus sp. CH26A]